MTQAFRSAADVARERALLLLARREWPRLSAEGVQRARLVSSTALSSAIGSPWLVECVPAARSERLSEIIVTGVQR